MANSAFFSSPPLGGEEKILERVQRFCALDEVVVRGGGWGGGRVTGTGPTTP
ncbi:MAG: hypothetical protein QOJ54_1293, partial [Aliidongia sp.]|nr:hypothetical protein [Aliidongia sp.]